MCDGEAAPGALWGGLFRPFEYIFHPRHSINCGFPDSTFLYTKVMYMYTCTVSQVHVRAFTVCTVHALHP